MASEEPIKHISKNLTGAISNFVDRFDPNYQVSVYFMIKQITTSMEYYIKGNKERCFNNLLLAYNLSDLIEKQIVLDSSEQNTSIKRPQGDWIKIALQDLDCIVVYKEYFDWGVKELLR